MMTCGPEIMMHFASKTALTRGIPAHQIWVSLERHMNCAIGHCGHCQLGPAFVCKDGPVFRYDHISPFLTVEGL
jgi:NAD(P)H-flavin reductase